MSNDNAQDVVLNDVEMQAVSDDARPEASTKKRGKVTRTMTMAQSQMELDLQGPPSGAEQAALDAKDTKVFAGLLLTLEVVFVIIYASALSYPAAALNDMKYYSFFRDVSIMIFFGFGYLMTFLRRYGFSAVGYTLMASVIVVQWSVPLQVFFENLDFVDARGGRGDVIGIYELMNGLFCAAAVMISFGAVLGKVTPTQLTVMGLLEAVFFWVNFSLGGHANHAYDVGGGMFIHTFGAYFGIAVAKVLDTQRSRNHDDNQSMVSSDIFSMAGTIILFVFWPSFNAAIATRGDLAVVNTFVSIGGSVVASFAVSRIVSGNKFNIVHVQNSTLAGGVAMGVAADLNLDPSIALLAGLVAGAVSVLGFHYVSPVLTNKLGVQDICGVHNLHGLPGLIGAIVGIFAFVDGKNSASSSHGSQPGRQILAIVSTLGFALVGGLITGIAMKKCDAVRSIHPANLFNDRPFWELPSDYHVVVNDDNEEAEDDEAKKN